MKCQRFFSIPLSAVFLLMGFVYYITLFVFIEDWVGLQSSAGSLNALIFTFFSSLCLVSFLASVLIDPGQVPASYVPDLEQTRASDQQPNKNWVMPRHVLQLWASWQGHFGDHRNMVVWRMVPCCVMWCIWRERNARHFEDCERSVLDLKLLFFQTLVHNRGTVTSVLHTSLLELIIAGSAEGSSLSMD
uniref:Uncharacterized protein n=1 Tax=Fagus sylvatica TaxID=28930 RepID=A0A2N9HMD7_FAGSY